MAQMPPKIQAALEIIRFFEQVRSGGPNLFPGEGSDNGRQLQPNEVRCYDAAMATLAEYFNTDGFGDNPPAAGHQDGPEPPDQPVPVTK